MNNDIKTGSKHQVRHVQTKQLDIQNLIDMCTKKLEQEPNHKKALLLRASSYIKTNELANVI
jgi:hypothetical protein